LFGRKIVFYETVQYKDVKLIFNQGEVNIMDTFKTPVVMTKTA